ncbi:hypothetical protein WJX73_006084 [Symbiochloris irregularis]|uniref:L domain-like protein n=1 Tax=Symbiochloris irregularis TaxID=706552 RepID=A0AAW1Q2Q1_9CHLO
MLFLVLAALATFRCQTDAAPTLTPGDEAVMQRCAALLNGTTDEFGNNESQNSISDNPCEWTNTLYLNVMCSNTRTPNTARVTEITWTSAAGDLSDLGLEELDALQSLTITSAAEQIGGGGPTNVTLTLSPAWATGLTSLQSFDYGPGTLKAFDSIFMKGGFPALTDLTISNTYVLGNYPAGSLPKAVDGAFPALTELSINNCSITEFPATWGSSTGMFGGLQSLVLNYNNMSGSLPVWTSSAASDYWANLNSLDLSYNQFKGSLPSSWAEPGSFGTLLTLILDNNTDITGTLPSNWASGLFRLSSSNQLTLEQAADAFLIGLENTTSDYAVISSIGSFTANQGGNAGTTATLVGYSFQGLGLSGSIPASWSNQSVANAVAALRLNPNEEQKANSPQYPHLSINAQGTNLCGSLPANAQPVNEGLNNN